jgi:NADH dehydrogenase/NADH:ubiquinone oxidoreductase subunit G
MGNPLFREYEKLVEITIHGKKFQVPEKNTLLRAFQYISPDTIPYGRFCWNQECQLCRVVYQIPNQPDSEPRAVLSCKVLVADGMQISELSDELKWTLRGILKPSEAES